MGGRAGSAPELVSVVDESFEAVASGGQKFPSLFGEMLQQRVFVGIGQETSP